MRNYHAFLNLAKPTPWDSLIYFDLETVETIEQMQRVARGEISKEEKKAFLNPFNAKFVAFGVRRSPNPVFATCYNLQYKTFKEKWTVYYNTEPLDAGRIALMLLDFALSQGFEGFCAHNGKRFDFLIFLKVATLRVSKGTFYLQQGKNFFKLVDTLDIGKAIGKASLSALAKHFLSEDKITFTAKSLAEYNLYDTYLLMKVAKEFEKLGFHSTPVKTARIWIAKVMKSKGIEKITQPKIELLDYIGGRVEVFYHKGENLRCFDANSLYPSVMSKFKHPKGYAIKRFDKDKRKDRVYLKVKLNRIAGPLDERSRSLAKERIAREIEGAPLDDPFALKAFMEEQKRHYLLFVKVKGIKNDLPEHLERFATEYFPFSYKRDRRLFRLDGDAVYQVQGYEVAFLKLFDWELLDGYWYRAEELFFAKEMEELYEKRRELKERGDDLQMLYKIIMNSTYGIFGLRDVRVEELKDELYSLFFYLKQSKRPNALLKRKLRISKTFDSIVYKDAVREREVVIPDGAPPYVQGREFSFFSIPVWATSITSCARFWLHAVIVALLKKGRTVYYCDTDSVYTDASAEDFEELELYGSDLLQWKLEAHIERFVAFAPKSYAYVEREQVKVKSKGTGRALIRDSVAITVNKSPTKAVVEGFDVKEVVRKFASPFGAPVKVPDTNHPNWKSKFNDDGVPFALAFPVAELVEFLPELKEELLEVFSYALEKAEVGKIKEIMHSLVNQMEAELGALP